MGVKELLVDSWNNMLKNNFILKSVLVALAYILIYIAVFIVIGICFAIHAILGVVAIICLIVFFIPISIATSKVLLDVFQGRDAKVFGFVGYGFKNAKKMWAIVGRTILKLIVLYIIKIVCFAILMAFLGSTIYGIVTDVMQGEKTSVYSAAVLDSTTSALDSTSSDLTDSLDSISSDLDSLSDTYDLSEYGLDSYSDYDLSQYSNSSSDAEALSKLLADERFMNALKEFVEQYGDQIAGSLGAICLYAIVAIVLDILIIMKKLYYTLSYYLAFENDDYTSRDVIEKSEELMRGNRGKYFWTMFLISLIYSLIVGFVSVIPQQAIVSIVSVVLAVIYGIYKSSYMFTFYTKLVGATPTAPVEAETVPPTEE